MHFATKIDFNDKNVASLSSTLLKYLETYYNQVSIAVFDSNSILDGCPCLKVNSLNLLASRQYGNHIDPDGVH